MFNFKTLTSAIVLSFAVSAIAGPVARESFITHPITKKSSGSVKSTVAKDQARLAKYNSAASSSATVTNDVDSYIAKVTVGSQTFDLIVDTGSSNTWVGANTKFTKGSTGTSTGKSVSVSYGSGSFKGTEYTDTVTIGTAKVASQSIGVASSATGFTGVDGIVGFGPVDLTEDTVTGATTIPTFLDNLYSKGTISSEVLGVSFAPESGSSSDSANGELTFGGTDSSKYTGSITYTPKSTSSTFGPYWGVAVSAITYDGTSLASSGNAIVDTGTTLIYIPTAAYKKFLSGAGGKTDSTTGLAKFTTKPTGTFSFTIGGQKLTLSPAQYLVPTAQYSNNGISGSAYYSWIGDGGASGVDFIIGQKFLENYYSVFDTTNKQVGFATAA
ncbi:acid protease [Athelia psychrophila]|uniref:Acid protease n=1 Tax=Athelia psychrophila TaxID=1759441 RepID=A0A165YQV3_9AGAM|nr:acid protease [Fibularhizoctonia sp. CBS 109695]KZP09820.1 acid protease [Fibularhizoctonia sp. CBS 109695]